VRRLLSELLDKYAELKQKKKYRYKTENTEDEEDEEEEEKKENENKNNKVFLSFAFLEWLAQFHYSGNGDSW